MTDDQHVEDDAPTPSSPASSSESELRAAIEAIKGATPGATAPGDRQPRPEPAEATDADVLAVWRLHEAAVEAEYHTHRFLGGGAARRQLHEALQAEAVALQRLGYESFAAFAAARGWKRPEGLRSAAGAEVRLAHDIAALDDERTMDRIRELLGELGLDAGEDPLGAAKAFLEDLDEDAAFDAVVAVPEVVAAAEAAAEEPAAPASVDADIDITREPDDDGSATGDDDLRSLEREDARAQRWHAELELLRADLLRASGERDAAQRAVDAVREEFVPLRDELATLQRSIEANATDLVARTAERDAAIAAREALALELSALELEGEALRKSAELAENRREHDSALATAALAELQSHIDALTADLRDARAEVARLESLLAAHEVERDAMRQELLVARAEADELAAQLDGTQSTLDALAAHAESIEAQLEAARRVPVPIAEPQPAAVPAGDPAAALLEQARADADALRQQAMREAETIRREALVTADGIRRIAQEDASEIHNRVVAGAAVAGAAAGATANEQHDDRITALADRVARMERKLAKQRRKLERTIDRLDDARKAERAQKAKKRSSRDELIALLARLVQNVEDA
jgi:hypothetical protein